MHVLFYSFIEAWLWKGPFSLVCLIKVASVIYKETRQQQILACMMRAHILGASLFYEMHTQMHQWLTPSGCDAVQISFGWEHESCLDVFVSAEEQ